jgi:hypothetical protein
VEENIIQDQPVELQNQPEKPWLKIIGLSVLGLVLVWGLVLTGIQIDKSAKLRLQIAKPNLKPQNLAPTQALVATSAPTLQPEKTPLADETAGWKSYTHNALNFSFRYPQDWQIGSTAEPVVIGLMPETLRPTDEPLLKLFWYENKNFLDLRDFYEELERNNQGGDPISPFRQEEPVVKKLQSGEVVYYFDNAYCVATCRKAVWAHKNGVYEFVDVTKGLGTNYQQKVQEFTFDQILSTFRFLPSGNSGQEE